MEHFQQSGFWAEFKSRHGWEKNFFSLNETDAKKIDAPSSAEKENLTVMTRRFDFKIKKISVAYCPMKPEILPGENPCEKLAGVAKKIAEFLPGDTIYIRFDPDVSFDSAEKRDDFVKKFSAQKIGKIRVKKSSSDVQPPDTVLLPLNESEEKILSQMKSKWRYNIKLAERKNVRVEKFSSGDGNFSEKFDEFFTLFSVTSKRDGVQFHSRNYYRDLFDLSAENHEAQVSLYLARHENDYLAGIVVIFYEKEAVYLYGASGNEKRNLMPSYLLQWNAIRDAKNSGCGFYDFYGCPPSDDKNHPMHGLFLFKTGFGGKLVHRPGSFDVILKRRTYFLYRCAEKIRSVYFKKIKKIFAGR
jgi:lipid II:glycine glycyltransferase (peptidoglycan interpeptide bridge formation enzyme)